MATENEGDAFAARETQPGFKKRGLVIPPGAIKSGVVHSVTYIVVLLGVCAVLVGPVASCQKKDFMGDCLKLHKQEECDLRWKVTHPYD